MAKDESHVSPRELILKYPYMFRPKSQVSFARGWIALFAQLCEDIDRILGGEQLLYWTEVKEKFGSARMRWELRARAAGRRGKPVILDSPHADAVYGTSSAAQLSPIPRARLREQIASLVRAAEDKTYRMCICCSQPGERVTSMEYMLVLCPIHTIDYEAGRPLNIWFREDGDP